MLSKRCFKCLRVQPIDAFYRHSQMRDGHLNKCIECTIADVHRNRTAKLDYYRSYDRARAGQPERVQARSNYYETDAYRISHAISSRRWDVSNALRKRAQTVVGNALRDGRLERQLCFVCGARAQAHHPDYSAPLAVSWLCPMHHAQAHKEHREWMREAA